MWMTTAAIPMELNSFLFRIFVSFSFLFFKNFFFSDWLNNQQSKEQQRLLVCMCGYWQQSLKVNCISIYVVSEARTSFIFSILDFIDTMEWRRCTTLYLIYYCQSILSLYLFLSHVLEMFFRWQRKGGKRGRGWKGKVDWCTFFYGQHGISPRFVVGQWSMLNIKSLWHFRVCDRKK